MRHENIITSTEDMRLCKAVEECLYPTVSTNVYTYSDSIYDEIECNTNKLFCVVATIKVLRLKQCH